MTDDGKLMLRQWAGRWHEYDGMSWRAAEDEAIRGWVYRRTENAVYVDEKKLALKSWAPTRARVNGVLHALGEAIALVPAATEQPAWLGGDDHPEPAAEIIAIRTGLLHVASGKLLGHDLDFFGLVAVGYGYDPAAPEPERWLQMMAEMWPDPGEADNIACLQEWMGYVLSGRTDQQKIGVLLAPRRSGKGTVGRVLTALLGLELVAAPMLNGLTSRFGMTPLIGKRLALISEAKLEPNDVFDPGRLLETSGEDRQTTDVKYRAYWTGTLGVRFMLLVNAFPSFRDSATAVIGRCLVMRTTATFYGCDDEQLTAYLVGHELPGILLWCLKGLERLDQQGRFTEPRAGAKIIAAMEEAARPVKLFADTECDVGGSRAFGRQALFDAWSDWCRRTGHRRGNISIFEKELAAQVPGVRKYRSRPACRPRDDADRPYQWKGIALLAGSTGSTGPATPSGAPGKTRRAHKVQR